MGVEDKLRELGIELPPVPMPLGSYVASVQTGNLVFVSGMLPLEVGILPRTGTVGAELSVEEAAHEARRAAINTLSVLKAEIGNLDRVKRCVKITGYIASTPDFTAQPMVLNGASDLMAQVFGEAGRHARAAVGVPVLPLNSPIEIECIFEVIEKKEKARRK
jgi:enamine deaminase RidA (YjgF/YER057c/UK114 family)